MDTAKSVSLQVPQVSIAELQSFHEAHFSRTAVTKFHSDFHKPSDTEQTHHPAIEQQEYEDEDDGLGYYSDGVKRTLTDEQIAIFRHSELQTLLREQEKKRNDHGHARLTDGKPIPKSGKLLPHSPHGDAPETSEEPQLEKKRWKKNRYGRKEDLRKRTWDVVEKGLDHLDYDDA